MSTVYSVLEQTAARYGDLPALYQGGRVYTWNEYRRAAEEIAAGLRSLGIAKGEIVALASEVCAGFYLADLGVMANGSIAAALYTSYPAAELVRTLRACDARAVFVQDASMLQCALERPAISARRPGDPAQRRSEWRADTRRVARVRP